MKVVLATNAYVEACRTEMNGSSRVERTARHTPAASAESAELPNPIASGGQADVRAV
ncbi:MAG: hypothetical protein U0587_04765 [Candidatus Binatia bacterium]